MHESQEVTFESKKPITLELDANFWENFSKQLDMANKLAQVKYNTSRVYKQTLSKVSEEFDLFKITQH